MAIPDTRLIFELVLLAEAVAVADPAGGEIPGLGLLAEAVAEATPVPKDNVIVGLNAEAAAPAVPVTGATAGLGGLAVEVEVADPVGKEVVALALLAEAVELAGPAAGETAAVALAALAAADAVSASPTSWRGRVRLMMIGWIGNDRPLRAMRDPPGQSSFQTSQQIRFRVTVVFTRNCRNSAAPVAPNFG